MYYQVKVSELLRCAIDRGIPATGTAIARSVGLSPPTVNRMLAGRPAHSASIALLTSEFGCTVEQLFRIVESDSDRDERVVRLLNARAENLR
jgi:plasmid maintenance system antidote protein VapI